MMILSAKMRLKSQEESKGGFPLGQSGRAWHWRWASVVMSVYHDYRSPKHFFHAFHSYNVI